MADATTRIAHEPLDRIVQHDKADHAELSLNSATDSADVDRMPLSRVELRVSDDGRGFDRTSIQPGHRGLSIIRERASATGADLTVRSQPDQEAKIVVIWEERQ